MKPLTRKQQILRYRFTEIAKVLERNQAKVDTYLPLKQTQAAFLANLDSITPLSVRKAFTTSAITRYKKQAKKNAIESYLIFLAPARSFCLANNLLPEAAKLNLSKRALTRLKDGDFMPLCKSINDLITNSLLPLPAFAPYNITPAILATAFNYAKDFNTYIGKAGAAHADKSAAAATLTQLFKNLRQNNNQLSRLIIHFKPSDPSFFKTYSAANRSRLIVRHTGIKGTVTDTATALPIAKATITNLRNTKSVSSNILSNYKHHFNHPGTVQFICSAPSYKTSTRHITLFRGTTLKIHWQLEKEQ